MNETRKSEAEASAKRPYTKPMANVVNLQPEERLMLCPKKAGLPGNPCYDDFLGPQYVNT